MLITVQLLHVLSDEVIVGHVAHLASPLALFNAGHFLIELEETTGVFLDVLDLDGDFISELELHLLQLATAGELLGLVGFIVVFTIVIRELCHDFDRAALEGVESDVQIIPHEFIPVLSVLPHLLHN